MDRCSQKADKMRTIPDSMAEIKHRYHLVLGTVATNYCDMIIKNRQDYYKNKAIGARNYNAKLDDQKVKKIRCQYPEKNQYELAEEYGVTQTAIGMIVRNRTWKHVT